MTLCKNCKYWSDRVSHDAPDYHECDRESIRDYPSNGFAAVDGEPYNHDSIATGPEFGCVLGEAKETFTKYYAAVGPSKKDGSTPIFGLFLSEEELRIALMKHPSYPKNFRHAIVRVDNPSGTSPA